MDALMAALVAALIAQASDRAPWLAARLADASARPGAVLAAAFTALVIGYGVGAAAGAVMAPLLTPNARALLLGLALLSAGLPALLPPKPVKDKVSGRAAFAAALITLLAGAMGDRTQFLTAAIAARSGWPVLAGAGAVLGAFVVQAAAILGDDELRRALPLTAIRIACALVLSVAGAVFALGALRLI